MHPTLPQLLFISIYSSYTLFDWLHSRGQ